MPESPDLVVINITCHQCRRVTEQSIGWIKAHSNFTCVCGAVIDLTAEEFRRQVADIDRAQAGAQGALKRLLDKL